MNYTTDATPETSTWANGYPTGTRPFFMDDPDPESAVPPLESTETPPSPVTATSAPEESLHAVEVLAKMLTLGMTLDDASPLLEKWRTEGSAPANWEEAVKNYVERGPIEEHPVYAYVESCLPPLVPESDPFYKAREGMRHEVLRRSWKTGEWDRPPVQEVTPLSTDDLLAVVHSEPAELIDGLVVARGLHATIAAQKVGKTFLAIQKSICIGAGIPFMGRDVQQGTVLMIEEEGSAKAFQERIRVHIAALSRETGRTLHPDVHWLHRGGFNISTDEGVNRLRRLIEQVKPVYLPIGPLSMVGNMADENSNAEMQGIVRTLLDLSTDYGLTIDIAHHRNKPQKDSAPKGVNAWFYTSRGASALIGGTDSNTGLDRDPEQAEGKLLQLNRDGLSFVSHYRFDADTLLHVPISADEATHNGAKAPIADIRIWMQLNPQEPVSLNEVMDHFDISRNTAKPRMEQMEIKGWVAAGTSAGKTYYQLTADHAGKPVNERFAEIFAHDPDEGHFDA